MNAVSVAVNLVAACGCAHMMCVSVESRRSVRFYGWALLFVANAAFFVDGWFGMMVPA